MSRLATAPAAVEGAFAEAIGRLSPLAAQIGDLKRVRSAGRDGSLAEQAGRRSWRDLCAGMDLEALAWREAATAVAACQTGPLDADVLAAHGLDEAVAHEVGARAIAVQAGVLGEPLRATLVAALPTAAAVLPPAAGDAALPWFVAALAAQPRAGATAPGQARLVLEPPESHLDHCQGVAVLGVLLAPAAGADPATTFLAGLAHHLHNATLPDAGFAGETLLGDALDGVVAVGRERALDALAPVLADRVRGALERVADAGTPEGRAFHAADVLDRVLQQRQHARQAGFTLDQALGDLALVHDGPVQGFQLEVLAVAGLWEAPAGGSP